MDEAASISTSTSITDDVFGSQEPRETPETASLFDAEGDFSPPDHSLVSSKKRCRHAGRARAATVIWSHARPPDPGEPKRHENGRTLWYCGRCNWYSVSSTSGARTHLKNHHDIDVEPEQVSTKRQKITSDIRVALGKQSIKAKDELDQKLKDILRSFVNPTAIRDAVCRLMLRRDLAYSAVE